MKLRPTTFKKLFAVSAASILLAACATAPTVSDGANAARANLNRLQADSNLAGLARTEIMAADRAVTAAEQPVDDARLSAHLVELANGRIDIARAWAQSRYYEEQRQVLTAEAENVRLQARTREADNARNDARIARNDADAAQAATVSARVETGIAQSRAQAARDEADVARTDATTARGQTDTAQAATQAARAETGIALTQAQTARDEADAARTDATTARGQAALARTATDEARAETVQLQQQISELNARSTDRGLVMTLGDIMFESGKAELRSGTTSNLDKLAAFLSRYDDRSVEIEGHTDNVGSGESNRILSRQRAESVADYLIARGIDSSRLLSTAMGEESPVVKNDTSTGRQQNRRVEVIISNEQEQQ